MTAEEQEKAILEAVEAHKDAIAERKKVEIKAGFLNPFGEETSYEEFLKDVEKSKSTIAEYCKDHLTTDQISWLEKDIKIFTNHKKK